MAKKNNDLSLAPSENPEWDRWGAGCGFTSWEHAAKALGITKGGMSNARGNRKITKRMRLAMAAVVANMPAYGTGEMPRARADAVPVFTDEAGPSAPTDAQCQAFFARATDFNAMIRAVYEEGVSRALARGNKFFGDHYSNRYAQAVKALVQAGPGIPSNWALTPISATPEMIVSGEAEAARWDNVQRSTNVSSVFVAMIAARPGAPK